MLFYKKILINSSRSDLLFYFIFSHIPYEFAPKYSNFSDLHI